MIEKLLTRFSGTRKYFLVTFLLTMGIILLGILTPYLIQNQIASFPEEREKLSRDLISNTTGIFTSAAEQLNNDFILLRQEVSDILLSEKVEYDSLFLLLSSQPQNKYIIEIYDRKGSLLGFNNSYPLSVKSGQGIPENPGNTFFLRGAIFTSLVQYDTIRTGPQIFFIYMGLPVLSENGLYPEPDRLLFSGLQNKAGQDFRLVTENSLEDSAGSDTLRVPLTDSQGNQLGYILYKLPSGPESQDAFVDWISFIQSLLLISILISILLGIRKDYQRIPYVSLRLILLIFFLIIFRWIVYVLDIVAIILPAELTDPAYFSSAFGGGIVKSPAEFLVTALFFFIIAAFSASYAIRTEKTKGIPSNVSRLIYFFFLVFYGALTALLLRGYAASMRSVIFDSSLSYFKDPSLIPSFPALTMNLGVFLSGGGVFLFILSWTALLIKNYSHSGLPSGRYSYLILFASPILFTVVLLFFTSNPLVTPPLALVFFLLTGILTAYFAYYEKPGAAIQIPALLLASVLSVSFMNHFNSELTKEELKTASFEFNRKNPGLYQFLMTDALEAVPEILRSRDAGRSGILHPATEAYSVWASLTFSKELYGSGIYFLDKNKKITGGFGYNLDGIDIVPSLLSFLKINSPAVFSFTPFSGDKNHIQLVGIAPFTLPEDDISYIAICFLYNTVRIHEKSDFPLIQAADTRWRSTLENENLTILNFQNRELIYTEGEFYPDKKLMSLLLDSAFTESAEKWITYNPGAEEYLFYASLNEITGSRSITATGIKIRTFTWNLFNFFKLFIIHSLFSLIWYGIAFLINLKKGAFPQYTFRMQLLIAFLFIAIIPMVVLAVYNRINITEKAEEGLKNLIHEKSSVVANYLEREGAGSNTLNDKDVFRSAFRNLDIHFSIYKENVLVFTTLQQLETAELVPPRPDPETLHILYREGMRDDFRTVSYGGQTGLSQFRKLTFKSQEYILEVNSLLNKVRPVILPVEIDIILFGVYSLAILLVIIISSFMANKISLPIKKLTKATHSVAGGDFAYDIPDNVRGELKELMKGFENMTSELQRNQKDLSSLEREAAWKEMARQVAHEIKNPLTPMKLTMQHLIHAYKSGAKNFDAIFDKVSGTIINQIEVLNQIASEFSRFARMPGMNAGLMNPAEVIDDTAALYNDDHVSLKVEHENKEILIMMDRSQFRRMLVNLIRNAIQAKATVITISTYQEYNSFIMTICDNGNGIPEEIREVIFREGFTTKTGGMGLGLSMTRRLIENAGGSITLEQKDDKGTCFKIILSAESNQPGKGEKSNG
ncbi:MAG: ATP-binding protein [Ignavibacteriaceae bacterium]|nr:ATP-binding protein [Ignavibacteriaceae bacterium]